MDKYFQTGWYVLYVRTSHEKKIDILLKEKQLESFLPLEKTIKDFGNQKRIVSTPLYPSYVFVKINSENDFQKASSIEGKWDFVQFGPEYAIVTDHEIEVIRSLVQEINVENIGQNIELPIIGDRMMIFDGSFSGLECEVLKIKNVNKVKVRIDSLQYDFLTTIPATYLTEIRGVA